MSAEPEFRKSSFSLNNGTCVEVAFRRSSFCSGGNCVDVAIETHRVELRDTADRRVVYSLEEWRAFVAGVKAGEFDA